MVKMFVRTAMSPTNIAIVKYWGKRDLPMNLPLNSSLSVTLHMDHLCTVTTVAASRDFKGDRLWLNGAEEIDIQQNRRLSRVLCEMRRRAGDLCDSTTGEVLVESSAWGEYGVHIVSTNSFPTAAGLASSASGYACLVKALGELFCVKEAFVGELTAFARMGSGSACRSLHGGFVRWDRGSAADGSDSLGSQVASLTHWPELEAVICVVSDHKKGTSSTSGMCDSVRTSELLKHRAEHVVPQRMAAMERAIAARDFESLATLTMRDSNQFHATCLDTFPPIFYLNDTSREIIQLVHQLNALAGQKKYAYTFDAGPNAVIFCLASDARALISELLKHYPFDNERANGDARVVRGKTNLSVAEAKASVGSFHSSCSGISTHRSPDRLRYIIHTQVGPGARLLDDPLATLVGDDGLPLKKQP